MGAGKQITRIRLVGVVENHSGLHLRRRPPLPSPSASASASAVLVTSLGTVGRRPRTTDAFWAADAPVHSPTAVAVEPSLGQHFPALG